jgi:hypothetical protein
MITHRLLTIDDTEQLTSILTERPEVFNGYTDDQFKIDIVQRVPDILTNPLWFNMGVFVDGDLHGAGLMKELSSSPAWVWGHWVARRGDISKMFTSEGIKAMRNMDRDTFDAMEQDRKLNRYYVAYRVQAENTLRGAGMSDRLFLLLQRMKISRGSTYKFFTDCTVEANEQARYPYQRAILADRIWPFKTGVRVGFKPED